MLDDARENAAFKSDSLEELCERTEGGEEKTCVANECVFVRWLKPIGVGELSFVSRDVLLLRVEKTLIFYNVKTQKEDVLVAGGNASTPSGGGNDDGGGLPLDGIACVDCCGTDLLALAEQPPTAKVIICRYPDFKVLATLIDDGDGAAYKFISFLRTEYLIGLRDYPAFDLTVWAWRVQEKLFAVNTGFIQPDQSLYLSANGRDVYLSHVERDARCQLQLWTVFIGCKTVYAERKRIELPVGVHVGSACWTPGGSSSGSGGGGGGGGWFVFCDSSANVYRVQPGVHVPELCAEYTGDNEGPLRPILCSGKQGFALYAADGLSVYKEVNGTFTKAWTIAVGYALQSVVQTGENDFYGWTNEGTLLELNQRKVQTLKVYGTNVKHFAFVEPADETVVTIDGRNVVQIWDVSTGQLKSEMKLNGVATSLSCNPLYGYVAVSFGNGKVELLKTDPGANGLQRVAKMILCDDELSSVHFFSDAKECVVTSFPTGLFYRVNIELGRTCSVMREHGTEKRVVDVEIIEGRNGSSSSSSFVCVLYAGKGREELAAAAGNNVVIFDRDFNAVFELNDPRHRYTSVFKWIPMDCANSDVVNVAFTAVASKSVHSMTVDVVRGEVLKSETVPLDHGLRSVQVSAGKNHRITYGPDGTYNLFEFDQDGGGRWKNVVSVNCSHWQTGGLTGARVDSNGRNVLTLSRLGNFMCTSFRETCGHDRRVYRIDTPMVIAENAETEGIGFEDGPESSKRRMTWTMINREKELDASRVAHSEHKNQIAEEFGKIKEQLVALLELNVNGPEETRINIEKFDLNVEHRQWFREKCKVDRREYEKKVLDSVNDFKTNTQRILNEHWESLFVKPKSIHCLKKLYKVDNYPISIIEQEVVEKAQQIIEKRTMNKDEESTCPLGENGQFSKDFNDTLDDNKAELSNSEHSSHEPTMGSISHRFVDTVKNMNYQHNYYKLKMAHDEIILLKFMVNKLKHSFNQLFDDMFAEKQRQLDSLNAYNDRLRVIETEFKLACKIEPAEPSPVDYEWNQYEQTDQLIRVEDDEVSAKPCRTPLSGGKTSADESSFATEKQPSPVDEFRQRALMDMMDGVLEKRWEDELKKDVPKPQCMTDKRPEDYTEEDLMAVDEYEKKTAAWNDERAKYKTILEGERAKINRQIEESVETFDDKVFELFRIKLEYDSAIYQECLKIGRLSKMLCDSDRRKRQIELHEETVLEIEKSLEESTKKIAKTETTLNALLNTVETLKHKNNVLNKRFKSEFPSKLIYEQALIAYNRRPKLQGNKNYSSLLGYQFVNAITDPTDDKLDLLCSEFVKYLDALRAYDDYKYVEDYKLNMDRETWHRVCNFRRLKIESEFKISTCQKEAADKANLLDNLTRDKDDKEATVEKLKNSVSEIEKQDSNYEDDHEIQLVVKQGNAEIELTGHFSDFDNAILIDKHAIDGVNAKIKEIGKVKINVLSNLLGFQRKCRFLKWEHEILQKHKIPLYKYRFDVLTSMKVTENMLHYLKFQAKGVNIDKLAEQKLEKEQLGIQNTYSKERKQLEQSINDLVKKIQKVKRANEKTDRDIDREMLELSQLKNEIDHGFTDKLKHVNDLRMKNIMKRAQMMTKIQELHKEVFALQTELELLLLKTYPTLYNIPKNASIRK